MILGAALREMIYNVSEAARRKTAKCARAFRCLRGEVYCSVVACLEGRSPFILCQSRVECAYRKTAAGRAACTCPTRGEIYRRYRV